MLDFISSKRQQLLPSPDVLHTRAQTSQTVLLVDGEQRLLPHFENELLEMRSEPGRSRPVLDRSGRRTGRRYWDDALGADMVDRACVTYVPVPEYASDYPFSLVMDTAWYTGLEGHNDIIAETFMKKLGVSVVVVGPEFSAASPSAIGAETNLARIALKSTSFSLMRSAEASATLYANLRSIHPEYNLSENIIGVGESRGAMIEQIRRVYMDQIGIRTLHSDITDPSANEQALQSTADVLKLTKWPVREVLGSLAVSAALLRSGNLPRHVGTLPMSARYQIGALVGTGPAILSGEEGMFSDFTALAHPQHIVNLKRNSMSDVKKRRERYAHHVNTTIIELAGCHLGLGYPSIQRRVIARSAVIGETLMSGQELNHNDWKQIHHTGRRSPLQSTVEPAA